MTWNPKQGAKTAARIIADADFPPGHIITAEWLAARSGQPDDPDPFKMITLRDVVTDIILKATGRYMEPVRGVGFRLLSPEESAVAIYERSLDLAERKICKGEGRLKAQRQDVLSLGAREQNIQAQITLSAVRGTLKRYKPQRHDADSTSMHMPVGPIVASKGGV